MPCACQLPIPNYPDTVEWGPLLWSFLHALAERAGMQTDLFQQTDERLRWSTFLQSVSSILPCPNCREHYKEWIALHPLTSLKTIPYAELRDWIRRWIFDLHTNVNERIGKPPFSWDALSSTYTPFDFFHGYHRILPPLKRAMELSGISYLKLNEWITQCKMLESTLGI